jgi:methionine-rich copper-binding protein CopC
MWARIKAPRRCSVTYRAVLMITWRRIALFVMSAFMLLGAPSAFPHAVVVRSNPSANVTVPSAPREVAIFFSERIQAVQGTTLVEDANGMRVDENDSRIDANGRVVRVTLKPLSPGTYNVKWRVQSFDKHYTEGSFIFHVQK